jgi:hypothetical protein
MYQDRAGRDVACAAPEAISFDAATPPPRPAPMPRQVVTFWTPNLLLAAALRPLIGMRRRPDDVVSAANADEP